MSANIENVEIGSVFGYVGEEQIGHTRGGGTLTVESDYSELRVDQYPTAIDWALNQLSLKFKLVLAEPTLYNLGLALPHATKFGSPSAPTALGIGVNAGLRLRPLSNEIRLHPVDLPDDDHSKDIYIWKAIAKESVELAYNNEDQRLLEVTFEALPDEDKPEMNLGRIGPAVVS